MTEILKLVNSCPVFLDHYNNSQISIVKSDYGCEDFTNKSIRFLTDNKGLGWMQYADGFAIIFKNYILRNYSYNLHIVSTFTCNWAKDFDGQGSDLTDFQNIKRSFHSDENILFVMGYTSEIDGVWKLEIFKTSNGEEVYKMNGIANKGAQIVQIEKQASELPLGIYTFNFTLLMHENKHLAKTEMFEIIDSN